MTSDVRERLCLDEQRELYDHWDAVRGDRLMPKRGEIDPTAIPRALPDLALMDVEGEGDALRFKVRLMGTNLAHRYGERTGYYLEDLQLGGEYDAIYAAYSECVTQRTPHVGAGDYWTADGHHMQVARLFLPLSEDGEHVTTVLAGIFQMEK